MFTVYMLPCYIEVFDYVSIGKVLKCGMCWCVLLSYFVVRCVLVTYSLTTASKYIQQYCMYSYHPFIIYIM